MRVLGEVLGLLLLFVALQFLSCGGFDINGRHYGTPPGGFLGGSIKLEWGGPQR